MNISWKCGEGFVIAFKPLHRREKSTENITEQLYEFIKRENIRLLVASQTYLESIYVLFCKRNYA